MHIHVIFRYTFDLFSMLDFKQKQVNGALLVSIEMLFTYCTNVLDIKYGHLLHAVNVSLSTQTSFLVAD